MTGTQSFQVIVLQPVNVTEGAYYITLQSKKTSICTFTITPFLNEETNLYLNDEVQANVPAQTWTYFNFTHEYNRQNPVFYAIAQATTSTNETSPCAINGKILFLMNKYPTVEDVYRTNCTDCKAYNGTESNAVYITQGNSTLQNATYHLGLYNPLLISCQFSLIAFVTYEEVLNTSDTGSMVEFPANFIAVAEYSTWNYYSFLHNFTLPETAVSFKEYADKSDHANKESFNETMYSFYVSVVAQDCVPLIKFGIDEYPSPVVSEIEKEGWIVDYSPNGYELVLQSNPYLYNISNYHSYIFAISSTYLRCPYVVTIRVVEVVRLILDKKLYKVHIPSRGSLFYSVTTQDLYDNRAYEINLEPRGHSVVKAFTNDFNMSKSQKFPDFLQNGNSKDCFGTCKIKYRYDNDNDDADQYGTLGIFNPIYTPGESFLFDLTFQLDNEEIPDKDLDTDAIIILVMSIIAGFIVIAIIASVAITTKICRENKLVDYDILQKIHAKKIMTVAEEYYNYDKYPNHI
eukprot:CAMPEP_0174264210 /NCGR_PEP_ID=MMETSP0439-20130205/21699_1 /TAXON_ID=0 /ORGANISM="Stereomyxa ramosa, Strain Chinc5" /LENGTH=516 /DNA_ID=CAMNT_0015349981 /DNA_START=348 /DNA_END=1898 /DNA_ORIENTATION=+